LTPAIPGPGSQHGRVVADEPRQSGVALLGGLPSSWVSWLLAWPMRLLYLGVWLAVPALLLARPGLRPAPADAFLTHDVLANVVLVALVAWTLVFLHELAHAVAVRALGCTGRLSLSRRLWFLVAQTEMSAIRTAPRSRRYAAYLAGMTWDVAVMLGCLLLELSRIGGQFPRTVVYTLTLSLIFQFSVFMRTDVYYVLANWLRLGNLMEDTRHLLANLAHRVLGRRSPYDMGDVPARELTVIRWYLPYYLLGSAAVTAGFALLTVPALERMVALAGSHLAGGPASLGFWDSLGFLAVAAFQFGALGFVTIRDRRRVPPAGSGIRAAASAVSRG
jgi:putative peptide zinc metalloprotease protein